MHPLSLLPQPRSLTYAAGGYILEGRRRIAIEGLAPSELLNPARRLQEALRSAGAEWSLSATTAGPDEDLGAVLRVAPDRIHQPQGYELQISPAGLLVEAHDPAGVFYGVVTLIQIVEQAGARLPALTIHDWPDFPARGVMLDVSRDKVPTLETLLMLVDMLAGWKINQLQLYTEHTFAYAQHPAVWAGASPITGEDMLTLDEYCRARFIELVPNQNCFGHMHRWLKLDQYRPLAEAPDGCETRWGFMEPFSLCPGDPGSLALVRDLLDELLPHCSSRMVNVGCDETVDLGMGRSRAECEQRGTGRVYLDFLHKIAAEVHARGRTMQFWGDMALEHPELVGDLPRDVIALVWGYDADHPFAEQTARFAAADVPFYVCPGTSSWRSIAGRTTNAIANLRAAAETGLANGAIGYLITDWGDLGHWQHLPVSFLGLAAGAGYAWAWEANRSLDLTAATGRYAFRDTAGTIGRIAHDLGDVYRLLGIELPNETVLFTLLANSLGQLPKGDTSFAERFRQALAAIDSVAPGIDRARMDRPDAALIVREFEQTARMLRHACRRGLLHLEGDTARTLPQRRRLRQDLREIVEEQRQIWLLRNRPGGLEDSLARFEPAMRDYQ